MALEKCIDIVEKWLSRAEVLEFVSEILDMRSSFLFCTVGSKVTDLPLKEEPTCCE
jgi:hypothetical protein